MEKRKVELYPIRSLKSAWDRIALVVLAAGLGFGLLAISFSPSISLFAVCLTAGFLGFILIKSRNMEPDVRRMYVWFFVPLALGVLLSVYPEANIIPLLLGGGIAALAVLWLGLLRYPPLYRAAIKAYRSGDHIQALNYLSQALSQYPNNWESYQLRCAIYLALFKIIEAEHDARKALEIKPGHYMCRLNLGAALMAQQRYVDAKDAFSRALESAPQIALNYYHRGLASYRLGEFQEAIRYFRVALDNEIPPGTALLGNYYLGNSLLQIGDHDQAKLAYQALKKYKVDFERLVTRYKDAPDYPTVMTVRRDLADIETHLT